MDEDQLVARARQGDAAAFGELVTRHRSAVFRAALAALGSHDEAEDAAQEAFLAAYRRLESFRGEASFKTWLLAIAWRQAINRRRSLKRLWLHLGSPLGGRDARKSRNSDAGSEALDAIAAGGPTPEEAAARGQLMGIVQDAIRRLTPKLKDTLLLALSGEYSYDEIAAMTGARTGTIKWRVAEARRVIKQRLSERGYRTAVAELATSDDRR